MSPLRPWIAEGFAPSDVDADRYRRIVRRLTAGRLALAAVLVGVVAVFGGRLHIDPAWFAAAVGAFYVPVVLGELWVVHRFRPTPTVRGVFILAYVGTIAGFTWAFPDLREMAPYAYLFVVARTAATAGSAASLAGAALAGAGSFIAWPDALSSPFHRGAFIAITFTMAHLVNSVGRQRNEAARAARENERRLEEAQALAHVGSWHWDLVRDEVTCSEELFRIFGYDEGGITGSFRDVLAHVHPDDRERVEHLLVRARETAEPFAYENRIQCRTGEERIVATSGRVITDESGRAIAMVGTGQDVTEHRRAEQATREALRREREASDRLRSLNEMKNSFLTAVSHELRTPLTSILGFAHTLHESRLPAEQREDMLVRLMDNADKLEQLLSDLLDIDRLERGILRPQRRPTDMAALVRTVAEGSAATETHRVHLELEPVTFPVDGPKVERIVENLVANAAKHTPAGTSIWIRLRSDPEGVLLLVEDAGPGVPDAMHESIFEPFRQGRSLAHSPGVGIGLSLVARFAELHEGRACVEDREGGGASFRILLRPEHPDATFDLEIDTPDADPHSVVGHGSIAAEATEPSLRRTR